MDHSVKVMNSHRKVAFSRWLFKRRRFENAELEALYQRYIFKLQQSSIVSVLLLLALLSVCISLLHLYYSTAFSSPTLISLYSGVQCVVFLGLFLLSFRMADTQLLALCYVILLFCLLFCALLAPINLSLLSSSSSSTSTFPTSSWFWWTVPHRPSEGVWAILFVVLLTYTMLPIRVTFAAVFSCFISAAHVALTLASVSFGGGGGSSFEDDDGYFAAEAEAHQRYIRKQVGSFLFY